MQPDDRRARLLRAAIGERGPIELLDHELHDWLALARTERAVPLVGVARRADRALDPTTAPDVLTEQLLACASAAVRIEHELLGAARLFDDAAIEFAVTKGVATCHLDHPDPSWRQFGDVDVLVAPAALEHVCDVLVGGGWRQGYALPVGHRRFTHAITFHAPSLVELDLHQRIGHRSLGMLVPTDELLAAREPFTIAGQTLWALSETDRLIHAAIHMVSSRGAYRRLSSVADVLLLSYLQEDTARAIVERADGWRVGTLVRRAVADAWAAAQLAVPGGWIDAIAVEPPRRARLVDAAYLGDRRRPIVEEVAHLWHLPDTRDRFAYLGGLLRPGAEYRAAKGRTTVHAQLRYLFSRTRSK